MFVVLCHFPECVLVHIRIKGEVSAVKLGLSSPVKYFLLTGPRPYFFPGSFVLYLSRVCLFCLFAFVALRPMSTAMVIAGRSVHLTTFFPGQA